MAQYLAIEPEYMWKVEPLEDGKLLTIATEYGEVRIAWKAEDARKLSEKMRTLETHTTKDMPGGSPDSNSGQGRS